MLAMVLSHALLLLTLFMHSMITGAANADVAILVVAAVKGEFEAGFTGGGQTKEHILLARGLGVTQIIVAVNKLDVDGWQADRYHFIQSHVEEYLRQQHFKPKRIQFVPVSGLTGENVMKRDNKNMALSSWYEGPTLLEAIDAFQPANRVFEKPPRFIGTS
jgi:elongation factor 1 alpha-like protein